MRSCSQGGVTIAVRVTCRRLRAGLAGAGSSPQRTAKPTSPVGGSLDHFHPCDLGPGRTGATPRLHGLDRGRLPFEDGLHPPVRPVADPARHAPGRGLAPAGFAEPDALDPAVDQDVTPDQPGRIRHPRQNGPQSSRSCSLRPARATSGSQRRAPPRPCASRPPGGPPPGCGPGPGRRSRRRCRRARGGSPSRLPPAALGRTPPHRFARSQAQGYQTDSLGTGPGRGGQAAGHATKRQRGIDVYLNSLSSGQVPSRSSTRSMVVVARTASSPGRSSSRTNTARSPTMNVGTPKTEWSSTARGVLRLQDLRAASRRRPRPARRRHRARPVEHLGHHVAVAEIEGLVVAGRKQRPVGGREVLGEPVPHHDAGQVGQQTGIPVGLAPTPAAGPPRRGPGRARRPDSARPSRRPPSTAVSRCSWALRANGQR